jgi:hypothetical protein
MLKKCEDRLKKGDSEQNSGLLEIENRYLREIKNLSDTFEAYKKQVEKHMAQILAEKALEKKHAEELEVMAQRLKQSMRASSSHHEVNTKRLKDKITKLEIANQGNEEEKRRLKSKCLSLKQ